MKIDIHTAPVKAIDFLVAKCEGYKPVWTDGRLRPVFRTGMDVEPTWPSYCTDPTAAQSIIERKKISTIHAKWMVGSIWWAAIGDTSDPETLGCTGNTANEAAMRAYLVGELGEAADVPEELLA